jgi:ubiquinone/menaquinone biosynthesis C-methylase UbiE
VAAYRRKHDDPPVRPRPFLAGLPADVETYEEKVAGFFRRRTGLDYYAAVGRIVEFVVRARSARVVDLLCDTAAFALNLAGHGGFSGRVYSFEHNVTLLERARQRARFLNLDRVEFRDFEEPRWPLPDGFADAAVSIFDFHRRDPGRFLPEVVRMLAPEGIFVLAELLEPDCARSSAGRLWERLKIRYIEGSPAEARGVYYGREETIRMLRAAGFRQVIVQELKAAASPRMPVFSLVAATK